MIATAFAQLYWILSQVLDKPCNQAIPASQISTLVYFSMITMFRFNSWDQARLIAWTLQNLPLTYPPGTHWAYANFGYCVLGRVIEKVTGQPYKDYVQQAVLTPRGITDMAIGGNTLKQRRPNQAMYFGQFGERPYNMNVMRMDSHGGWIATMTTPAPAYPSGRSGKYTCGWMVRDNGKGNWWHGGDLPGTTSVMVRTSNGMCWGALTNTRTLPASQIESALDQMVWDMVSKVPESNS